MPGKSYSIKCNTDKHRYTLQIIESQTGLLVELIVRKYVGGMNDGGKSREAGGYEGGKSDDSPLFALHPRACNYDAS